MIQLDLFNDDGTPCVYNTQGPEVEAYLHNLWREWNEEEEEEEEGVTSPQISLEGTEFEEALEFVEESYAFYLENRTEYPIQDFCSWYEEICRIDGIPYL